MKNWSKKKIVAILCVALSLFVSGIVIASDEESVYRLAAAVAQIMARTDYDVRDNVQGRCLRQGGTYTFRTTLFSGYEYVLIGAGDSSVRDLDLILYDENWHQVDRDSKADNVPIVTVSPRWSGTFYVKIKMYSGSGCSNVAVLYR